MFSFFKTKKDTNEELKKFILKKYFNSKSEKKAIENAAKKSSEEQNKILIEYRRIIKQA